MREFQEKKRWRKYLYSKITVLVLSFLIIYFAHAAFGLYLKERQSAQNEADSLANLEQLQSRQATLAAGIDSLNTQEGIDSQIRSQYSVEKPGERMIIIVDNNNQVATSTASSTPPAFWQKILQFFKL